MTQTIENKVERRVFSSGRGSVFTPSHFADLGGRDAIDKVLSRLTQSGTLRRLARGVYHYPKRHPIMGDLAPSAEVVAHALANRDRVRLQPSGAYAANLRASMRSKSASCVVRP